VTFHNKTTPKKKHDCLQEKSRPFEILRNV